MRLFVALEAPESLHAELCRALSRFQTLKHRGINWVKTQNLHLTVNFIGEVPEHRLAEISQAVAEEAEKHQAPELYSEGIELFPHHSPRLIWLKLGGNAKALAVLNRQLLGSMRALQIDADPKKLKPHITLGRLKEQQRPEFEREVLSFQIPSVKEIWNKLTLYRSVLSPQGPRYDIIEQYNLK